MNDFALTFFYGFDMYRVLGSLRTQYWFWFVRDKLIELELRESRNNKRKENLKRQKENATLTHIYSDKKMAVKLQKLSPYSNFEKEFTNNGKKYRKGERVAHSTLVKLIDQVIPGSMRAYEEGPQKLFLMIESDSMLQIVYEMATQLLIICKNR